MLDKPKQSRPLAANGHSKVLILESSRTRSRGAGRHAIQGMRPLFDQANSSYRLISHIHATR